MANTKQTHGIFEGFLSPGALSGHLFPSHVLCSYIQAFDFVFIGLLGVQVNVYVCICVCILSFRLSSFCLVWSYSSSGMSVRMNEYGGRKDGEDLGRGTHDQNVLQRMKLSG